MKDIWANVFAIFIATAVVILFNFSPYSSFFAHYGIIIGISLGIAAFIALRYRGSISYQNGRLYFGRRYWPLSRIATGVILLIASILLLAFVSIAFPYMETFWLMITILVFSFGVITGGYLIFSSFKFGPK